MPILDMMQLAPVSWINRDGKNRVKLLMHNYSIGEGKVAAESSIHTLAFDQRLFSNELMLFDLKYGRQREEMSVIDRQ